MTTDMVRRTRLQQEGPEEVGPGVGAGPLRDPVRGVPRAVGPEPAPLRGHTHGPGPEFWPVRRTHRLRSGSACSSRRHGRCTMGRASADCGGARGGPCRRCPRSSDASRTTAASTGATTPHPRRSMHRSVADAGRPPRASNTDARSRPLPPPALFTARAERPAWMLTATSTSWRSVVCDSASTNAAYEAGAPIVTAGPSRSSSPRTRSGRQPARRHAATGTTRSTHCRRWTDDPSRAKDASTPDHAPTRRTLSASPRSTNPGSEAPSTAVKVRRERSWNTPIPAPPAAAGARPPRSARVDANESHAGERARSTAGPPPQRHGVTARRAPTLRAFVRRSATWRRRHRWPGRPPPRPPRPATPTLARPRPRRPARRPPRRSVLPANPPPDHAARGGRTGTGSVTPHHRHVPVVSGTRGLNGTRRPRPAGGAVGSRLAASGRRARHRPLNFDRCGGHRLDVSG